MLAVAVAMVAIPALGASGAQVTNYWSAGIDGNFDVDENWSAGVVPYSVPEPGNQHNAYINGSVVTLNTPDHTARILYVNVSTGGAPAPAIGTALHITGDGEIAPDRLRIGGGGTVTLDGGATLTPSAETTVGHNGMTNQPAIFNVSNATHVGSLSLGSQSSGILNLSGTGQVGGSSSVYVGNGAAGVTGTVNQTNGTLTAGSMWIGGGAGGGTYNLSGGTVQVNTRLRVGDGGDGLLNMTGGTLNASNYPVWIGSDAGAGNGVVAVSDGVVNFARGADIGNAGNDGTGTIRIIGNDASINISNVGTGTPLQSFDNGTMNFQITADGISAITANGGSITDGRTILNLSGTLDLDLLGGFVPSAGQTFTLITTNVTAAYYEAGHFDEAEYLVGNGIIIDSGDYSVSAGTDRTNTGLSLAAADQSLWTIDVVALPENAGYSLVATYVAVPEPASMALLGLAVPALLRRRRRA